MSLPVWIETDAHDLGTFILMIYCQPGAKNTEVQGLHDGRIKIRLAAPPVDGKANSALIAWLSKRIRLPQHSIELVGGELNRHKRIRLRGVNETQLQQLIDLVPDSSD